MFSWNQGGGLEVFCGETRFEGHMLWSQNPRRGWSFKKKKVCKVLGPRFDKNGWKFKLYTNIVTQEAVVNLYTHVYEKEKILNDTITLEFVRILVAKYKRIKLN
jgi:hypothetical protein